MSRRGRAIAFLLLALAAAGAAAAIAEGYGSRVTRGYGPLRPVVVVESALPSGARFDDRQVGDRSPCGGSRSASSHPARSPRPTKPPA